METGQESPQSISFTGYYKGYSVTITKRDVEAKVMPLIEEVVKAIDSLSSNENWKPSWNQETNKAAKPEAEKWLDPPTELGKCKKCGSPNAMSKNGKPYCSAKCWLK